MDSGQVDADEQRKTLERVAEGVVSLDSDLTYTYANQRALDLLEMDREELLDQHVWDVFPKAEDSTTAAKIDEAIETQQEVVYERYNKRLDIWLEVRIYPDENGISMFFRDITDRKQRELELERYERIVENLPVGVGQNTVGEGDSFDYVNETLVEMLHGDSRKAVREHAIKDIYADAEERKEIIEKLKTEGRVEGEETCFETFDGDLFWGSLTATLETVEDQTQFIGILEDITARKRRERRIEQLHEATRDLVEMETREEVAIRVREAAEETLEVPMCGVHLYDEDEDGLVPVSVSERGQKVIGDPPTITDGIAWRAFETGEAETYGDVRTVEGMLNEETKVRSEMILPLGEYGVLLLSSTTVGDFDESDEMLGRVLASNATAVLDRIENEQRLRERKRDFQRAETLFANAQDAFFLVNVDHDRDEYRIERVNPAYEEFTGLENETIQNQTIVEIFGETDGQAIRSRYEECVRRGETIEYVEELAVPEPESYWETRIAPVIVDGDVVQIVGATRNITERKAYEEQLEEQRDNLELLNQIVRHDIRNDLQVISSYAELLASRIDDADREYVDRILDNARTAVDLTRSARELSGTMLQTDESTEPMALKRILLEQVDEIRTSYADAIVRVDQQIPNATIEADDMLPSVFRNVIKNAIQHNDKEVPEVEVSVAADDQKVRVTVADNGPGIPEDQKSEMFGKGQKGLESEGTGIGLYLVNTLVDRYGGDIQVHDNAPEGTIVTLTFEKV